MKVICLDLPPARRYHTIASAMAEGIRRCGDKALVVDARRSRTVLPAGDVAVMYGYKRNALLRRYPQWLYADLGYWRRGDAHRICANDWSPHQRMGRNMSHHRFDSLGIHTKPWRTAGTEILIAGSSRKACTDQGLGYMEWEERIAKQLANCGRPLMYRPKPKDPERRRIAGIGYDERPLQESLASAYAVVTHHSNVAVDALLAGVPVHCETGVAAAFSVPLAQIANAPLLAGREQFLSDVAWLEWTTEEIRAGECWRYAREHMLSA
jgi:hypothetical protein